MLQPSLPYNILKFSLQMFRCAPRDLEKNDYEAVRSRAVEECALQVKILTSKEGIRMVVPEKSVQEAMAAIAARYESPEAFVEDLTKNELDLKTMASALEVDLAVEAAITYVAAQSEPPTDTVMTNAIETAGLEKPEQRRVSHILITINEQFPENSREAALDRIKKVQQKARTPGVCFSDLAGRYSECPSALQGGSIGLVTQGTIHATLQETLFAMEVDEISEVVESTMGFHVLRCEEIIKAEKISPEEAVPKIRKILHTQIKKKAVQAWLASL